MSGNIARLQYLLQWAFFKQKHFNICKVALQNSRCNSANTTSGLWYRFENQPHIYDILPWNCFILTIVPLIIYLFWPNGIVKLIN